MTESSNPLGPRPSTVCPVVLTSPSGIPVTWREFAVLLDRAVAQGPAATDAALDCLRRHRDEVVAWAAAAPRDRAHADAAVSALYDGLLPTMGIVGRPVVDRFAAIVRQHLAIPRTFAAQNDPVLEILSAAGLGSTGDLPLNRFLAVAGTLQEFALTASREVVHSVVPATPRAAAIGEILASCSARSAIHSEYAEIHDVADTMFDGLRVEILDAAFMADAAPRLFAEYRDIPNSLAIIHESLRNDALAPHIATQAAAFVSAIRPILHGCTEACFHQDPDGDLQRELTAVKSSPHAHLLPIFTGPDGAIYLELFRKMHELAVGYDLKQLVLLQMPSGWFQIWPSFMAGEQSCPVDGLAIADLDSIPPHGCPLSPMGGTTTFKRTMAAVWDTPSVMGYARAHALASPHRTRPDAPLRHTGRAFWDGIRQRVTWPVPGRDLAI